LNLRGGADLPGGTEKLEKTGGGTFLEVLWPLGRPPFPTSNHQLADSPAWLATLILGRIIIGSDRRSQAIKK